MKTVFATLDIQVFVDCHGCGLRINLLDERGTDNYDHNFDGGILGGTWEGFILGWTNERYKIN